MAEDAAFFHEVEGVAVVGRQAQIVNHDEDGLAALLQIIEKEEQMCIRDRRRGSDETGIKRLHRCN